MCSVASGGRKQDLAHGVCIPITSRRPVFEGGAGVRNNQILTPQKGVGGSVGNVLDADRGQSAKKTPSKAVGLMAMSELVAGRTRA